MTGLTRVRRDIRTGSLEAQDFQTLLDALDMAYERLEEMESDLWGNYTLGESVFSSFVYEQTTNLTQVMCRMFGVGADRVLRTLIAEIGLEQVQSLLTEQAKLHEGLADDDHHPF